MHWEDSLTLDHVMQGAVLDASFYVRPAVEVARALLGKVLVHGAAAGRIVEVEAYLGVDDLAAHSAAGVTSRTRVLFGPPGRAYVYLIYGMYECLNLVAEPEGAAGCVLIRALEPVTGVDVMRGRRQTARRLRDLCSGPGKLTRALGITRALNGADVTRGGDLTVRSMGGEERVSIVTTPRIGITKSSGLPLRFYVKGSEFVS